MGGQRQKPDQKGAAKAFVTRAWALKRLQLPLKTFRRICILKGIHPHMPRHPKKAARGSTAHHTFYLRKDIQFLEHEPLIGKIRAMKVYKRRLKKAMAKSQKFDIKRLKSNKPKYTLDHIVKERYPTFAEALKDLDDCLCMLFLFATFPKSVVPNEKMIRMSRRLTVEFMNYVIANRALRKVFISVKGYYYQADIQGETVTWLVPHKFPFERPLDVDFRIMTTFAEFNITMLGFVNYRLYHASNLAYPPKFSLLSSSEQGYCLDIESNEERLAALSVDLESASGPSTLAGDSLLADESSGTQSILPQILLGSEDAAGIEQLQERLEEIDKLKSLFSGLKFFISREVPREPMTFAIRCLGGTVSWESGDSIGATFGVDDSSITHQLIDRPVVERRYISRAYVQPQWIFDCINARRLVSVEDYLPGATLPPHLSPFIESQPVVTAISAESSKDLSSTVEAVPPPILKNLRKKQMVESLGGNQADGKVGTVSVKVSEGAPDNLTKLAASGEVARREAIAERKLREMMMPKKNKRLYSKIMYKKKMDAKEGRALDRKRAAIQAKSGGGKG